MTYVRWWDDEDSVHENLAAPSANEQLLRYIGLRDSSVVDIDRDYLHRADASFIGTDFP